jgi:hypothetical protein
MRAKTFSALVVLTVISLLVRAGEMPGTSLRELPAIYDRNFKVDPYVQAAALLQSLGRAAAVVRLHEMANERADARVIVLCRMLFVPRPGSVFRAPALGGPQFLGGSVSSDWPLQPIEVVDGLPFLITTGYFLAGKAESDEQYLQYCEANGDWSDYRYTLKTSQQKQRALGTLLASNKWNRALAASEQEFLVDQIQ